MVNTSKILTVSYGTFSCTLEGFDDSFDTMKAIAEYFRDLAADDRYFGAEPPTPDADMLARIAEREIARRVEAHENEGKIVLRAGDASAFSGLSDAQAPQQEPVTEAPESPANKAQEPVDDHAQSETLVPQSTGDVAETPKPATSVTEMETPDEVAPHTYEAAKAPQTDSTAVDTALAINEPVEGRDTVAVREPGQTAEGQAENDTENHLESELETGIAANAPVEYQPDTELQPAATEDEQTEAVTAQSVVEPVVDSVEDVPEDDADSVAAKLRRIRSVVSHSGQEYGDSAYTEDEHAQDFVNATAADLDEAFAQDNDADIAAAAQDDAVQMQDDSDDLDALLARFDDDTQDVSTAETADFPDSESHYENVELAEDTLAQLLADAMPDEDETHDRPNMVNDDFGAPLRLGPESAIDNLETAIDDGMTEADDSDEDLADDIGDNEPVDQPVLRARVVKIKRSEFEAALAEGYIEEDEDETETWNVFGESEDEDDAGDDPDIQDSGLSPEEEAELQRELAEVEAELKLAAASKEDAAPQPPESAAASGVEPDKAYAAETQAEHASQIAEEPSETALTGREKLDIGQKPKADVNRIFDKADTQLDEPESNQRRSVIRHLRAAVAATRAEQRAGAELDKNVDDTPYRSDLQEVVRPRRPQSSGAGRLARSEDQRPTPLKLVAEQRVDTDVQRDPVRPRRISSSALVSTRSSDIETDNGFADFAQQMGATRLPDLLEAAAAYLSDIEGRPQFSRPMLMGKLKEVSRENFSREDGLRSFGQLLRDGKLQKLKGGRFTVTEETDFRDRTRNAG